MKRILFFILMIAISQLATSQSENLKKLDDKNGFKDMTFGMSVIEMKPFMEANPIKEIEDENTKVYKVTKEDFFKVSKYTIKEIEAWFFDGKLYMIKLYLEGAFNTGGMLDILERTYGKGNQVEVAPQKEKWVWIGQKVLLSFDKRSYHQDTEVIFESEALSKARREFIENYGLDDL